MTPQTGCQNLAIHVVVWSGGEFDVSSTGTKVQTGNSALVQPEEM